MTILDKITIFIYYIVNTLSIRTIIDKNKEEKTKMAKNKATYIRVMNGEDWDYKKENKSKIDLSLITDPEVKKRILAYTPRHGSHVDGLPEGPKGRHACEECKHKRMEKDLKTSGLFESNNYKAWLLWTCADGCAKTREKDRQKALARKKEWEEMLAKEAKEARK